MAGTEGNKLFVFIYVILGPPERKRMSFVNDQAQGADTGRELVT